MSYNVSPDDVAARWRALSDDESDVATVLLADVTDDLDVHRPTLHAFLATLLADADSTIVAKGELLQRIIVKTLAGAVRRVLRNPDVLTSTNISGDGGIGVGYDNHPDRVAAASASLLPGDYVDIDLATLAAGGTAPTQAGSVKLRNPHPFPLGPRRFAFGWPGGNYSYEPGFPDDRQCLPHQ
jgi:hypothetical protein